MKNILKSLLLLAFALPLQGHIGSPGVTLEGEAGPYQVTVLVNPPDVIPGVANIDVFVQGSNVTSVEVKPVYWYAGEEGTPRADKALPVPEEPGHFTGELWLMASGTSSVKVELDGSLGKGSIVVPIMAVSTAQKSMPPSLGYTLAGLGIFLVILMTTIVALAVSDSKTPSQGENPDNKMARKRWRGAVIGFAIIVLVLYGGNSWWQSWASNYNRFMYKPWQANSSVEERDGVRYLKFQMEDMKLKRLYLTRSISYLVPDHGKIMHMFLIKDGDMDAFAHIHPQRLDTANFEAVLPPLPEGRYFVYADVSRLSGFAETIVDTVDLPAPVFTEAARQVQDKDDTWYITDPLKKESAKLQTSLPGDIVVCGNPGVSTTLPDSSQIVWEMPEEGRFTAGKLYSLTFSVTDPQGEPAELEPYLGMMGHAVVVKEDASVYIHLHPVGSYSTASKQTLEARLSSGVGLINWNDLPPAPAFADSIDRYIEGLAMLPEAERDSLLMEGMDHEWEDPEHEGHSVVQFPYSFPTAGKYRVFIQMKRNGRILNSAFDVDVADEWGGAVN